MSVYLAIVRECMCWSILVKARRMRSMSELRPLTKSSQYGRFLNAVMEKLSERVNATKGQPVLRGGPESLSSDQMYHDALLYGQALRLVHRQREPSHDWELSARHPRPFFHACHG